MITNLLAKFACLLSRIVKENDIEFDTNLFQNLLKFYLKRLMTVKEAERDNKAYLIKNWTTHLSLDL